MGRGAQRPVRHAGHPRPLHRADYTGDELRVPFDKAQLRNAPHHDPGNELSSTDEADLYRYDRCRGALPLVRVPSDLVGPESVRSGGPGSVDSSPHPVFLVRHDVAVRLQDKRGVSVAQVLGHGDHGLSSRQKDAGEVMTEVVRRGA